MFHSRKKHTKKHLKNKSTYKCITNTKKQINKKIKQIKKIKQTNKKSKLLHSHKGGSMKCSPLSLAGSAEDGKQIDGCLPKEKMDKLKNMWNNMYPKNRIETDDISQMWQIMKNSSKCDTEICVLKKLTNNEIDKFKEFLNYYAPKSPEEWKNNPNAWLSNFDILKVMKHYEIKYKNFKFFGPAPIDFDQVLNDNECVDNDICKIELKKLKEEGKTLLGFIFNTDPHNKSGAHWISMFVSMKKGEIFFFDSAGDKAPKEIIKLSDRLIKQGKEIGIDFKFDQNYPTQHQYSNTECGVYSLYFIIHMLENKLTSEYLKTHILKDKYIEKYRKIYFN